jgi:hypothetical protein
MAPPGTHCGQLDKVESEDGCREAAGEMAIEFGGVINSTDKPDGCFYNAGEELAYLNSHEWGVMSIDAQMGGLCNGCRESWYA